MAALTKTKPETTTDPDIEMVYVVDGDLAPRSRMVKPDAKAGDIVKTIARELGRDDLDAMYREDEDKPIAAKTPIGEILDGEFQMLHVGSKHDVKVEVTYNGRTAHKQFAPSVTIRVIIAWAISPKGLGLQGEACDFQLKQAGEILPLELHIGQLSRDRETVRLALVFKVKPQG